MPGPAAEGRSSGPTGPRTLFPALARRGLWELAGAGLGARTPNEATWRAPTLGLCLRGLSSLDAILLLVVGFAFVLFLWLLEIARGG